MKSPGLSVHQLVGVDNPTTDAPAPLAVILVHWNRPTECLASIASIKSQGMLTSICLVDNGSHSEALSQLSDNGEIDDIVALDSNIGFGPAANIGLRRWLDSDVGQFVVVAPHDAVLEQDCLRTILREISERPEAGIACAEYGIGQRQVFSWLKGALALKDVHPGAGWKRALYPHGTLMVLRRQFLLEVGLFDEMFFAYGEEQDLGLRANKSGWEVGIVWGAVVRNPIRAASSAVTYYLLIRNSILLVRKHAGFFAACIRTGVVLANTVVLLLLKSRRSPSHSTGARIRAVVDFWRGRLGPPPLALTLHKD